MDEFENNSEWVDISERIDSNERMAEKAVSLQEYLDKEWEQLILQRTRIEKEIERASNSEH